jgi:Tfp pilus assembly protein PilP
MLRAMKVTNKTMNIYAAFLLITILLLSPISLALSEEAVKPEGENTLGDGLKAIQEAEGRIDVNKNNEDRGINEGADDTQTENSKQAENNSEAGPGNGAQVDKTQTETQGTANKSVKDGLPRGDSLRNAEKPRYDSTGMRDPFKPFIKLVDRPSGPLPIVKPPIRRYPLSSFRLAGIIWIGDEPKAMIVDPEMNTYFLGVGDKIGNKDGEILEVRDRGILVQEKTKLENVYGEVKIEVKKSVLAFQN